MCERWRTSFENFLADMGERPSGTSLDRIDANGNYEPGNCRWADSTTQARNASHVVVVDIDGESKPLVEWCEIRGLSINTVRDRVKFYGMTYAEAIMKPKQRTPFSKVTGGD